MNRPSSTTHESTSTRGGVLFFITLILLLAAGTRILGTADRPVWTDEGFMTWITSDLDVETVVDRAEIWDRHAPLYVFVVGGWREIAGESRIVLRFWAIMSGLVATALVYRIGADTFGAQIGRYAALLFAVLEMAVYYGQEIRGYGWLIMAVCWMAFFFLRYLRHPRPIWLIGFALSVALMLYTVYLGVVILVVMGLIVLVWRGSWRHRFALLGAVIAGVALFTPWLIVILRQRERVQTGIQGAPGTYATTWENIRLLSEFVWGDQLALMLGVWAIGRVSPFPFTGSEADSIDSVVKSLDVGATLQSRPGRVCKPSPTKIQGPNPFFWHLSALESFTGRGYGIEVAGLFLILAGAGVFVGMMIANVWVAVVAARTLVVVTPFVMLVCGIGLAQVAPPARGVLLAILVGLSLITSPVIQPRLAYDVTAQSIAAEYARGDLVILETGWDDNPFLYELALVLPDSAEIIRTLPWVDPGSIAPVVPQVEDTMRAHDRVWVVQWLTPSQVMPWLDSGTAGFQRVLAWQESIGQAYITQYPDYPPTVQIALYERPMVSDNADELSTYGDLLVLRDAVIADSAAPGERLHVDLWWSMAEQAETIDRDYSVGVYLMPVDEDRVIEQHDGSPGDRPTSQWDDDMLLFDRHTLTVPDGLAPGVYRVAVAVYWFGDGVRLPVDGGDVVAVGDIVVQ